ncbi:uncharacterized LOC729966 homolog [Candoia aspera]|uniref:uncharacterized LOC729966 homolog n=1 Tax=Candoia aspera TaxID=51853 RepID=UPI002FD856F8
MLSDSLPGEEEPAVMALWVLFSLVAFTQGNLSASDNISTTSLLDASTASTITAGTVSDTTQSIADVTSKAASSSIPQPTEATSNTPKTNDSNTSLITMISPTSSKEPLTSQMAEFVNSSTQAGQPSPELQSSLKPGLVVVICIFVSILLIGAVVVLIKCCHPKKPAFKKLDEVPMGKVAEDSPFARYPPK